MVVWKRRMQTPVLIVNGAGSFLFMWQQAKVVPGGPVRMNRREGAWMLQFLQMRE